MICTASILGLSLMVTACDQKEAELKDEDKTEQRNITHVLVQTETTYQTISGFGGANRMWGTNYLNSDEAEMAFGTNEDQIGLSIFRVRIASNPSEWSQIATSVKEAQKHGAKILASPWSPPAALKSNGSDIGGHLLEENYGAYARHINAYLDYMNSIGVDIYAISIQNEPDIQVSYESCDWTASQINDFVKNYGDSINCRIAAPESFHFNQNMSNMMLNDAETVDKFEIVAGHIYGSGLAAYPLAEQKGKEIWMTEYLLNLNATDKWQSMGEDQKWEESLEMLRTVHVAMQSNWNAYIWWYLERYYSFIGDGSQGSTAGELLKRGYAFSHFSKFVRPGYKRVKVTSEDEANLEITAYEGNGEVVIEILNRSSQLVSVGILAEGFTTGSATMYATALNVNQKEYAVEMIDGEAVLISYPQSITTVILKQ